MSLQTPSPDRVPASRWPLAVILAALAAGFLPVASVYVKRYSVPIPSAVSIYLCFLLLCLYEIGLALPAGRWFFGKAVGDQQPHFRVVLLLMLPYLVYATGTEDFRLSGLLRLLAITLPVVLVYRWFPVSPNSPFTGPDLAVACWLVGIVLFQQLRGIWNVPLPLDFMARLYLVSLGAFTWLYLRPVPRLGYTLTFSQRVGAAAAINFFLFTLLALPAGFALGFLSWNPRWHGTTAFVLDWLEIFLFIALLEEIFFRGFLQNLLSQSWGSWWRGQLVASCVFGLFHIRHAPFPNWRYVVLASVAGWFYGSAYRHSGTIFGSALVHAMVDTVWRTLFTRG